MTPTEYKTKLRTWRTGATGFLQWLADFQPRVPSPHGSFIPFELTDRLREEIREGLSGRYRTWIISMPRRHGKSALAALVALWRLTCFSNQTLIMIANSERQTTSTCFRLATKIIRNTPALLHLIGDRHLGATQIEYPDLGNSLTALPQNDRSLYGMKINLAQVSEMHAATDDAGYQTLASSLGDSADGLMLVDSTAGSRLSPLYKLHRLWETHEDPSIYETYISYRDLAEALEESPSWLSRDWLRSRAKQLLPAIFNSQHLNLWVSGSNSLFPDEVIQKCLAKYGVPVQRAAIPSLIGASKYAVGGGLDRAYGFSLHGDRTVFTATLKTVIGDESHYWILFQKSIPFSSGATIKKVIEHCHAEYGLHNTILESYNCQDIWSWTQEKGIPNELVHATSKSQIAGFSELHLIASEGRLHISDACTDLLAEMRGFEYQIESGGNPSFGGSGHDDFVYSAMWSIFATREVELAAYEISGVACSSRHAMPEVCFLMGANLTPLCAAECASYREVADLYAQHQTRHPESDATIAVFFRTKVRNAGAVVYRW